MDDKLPLRNWVAGCMMAATDLQGGKCSRNFFLQETRLSRQVELVDTGWPISHYMVVTPEIEVFYMLFDRSLSIFCYISRTAYGILQFPVLNPVGPP